MQKLIFIFIIGASFSIYPADDHKEFQKQLVYQFLDLHTVRCKPLSSTNFLQKYSEEITNFIEKDSEKINKIRELNIVSFSKECEESSFKYFDILQKSDHNAYAERGDACGRFLCALLFKTLDGISPRGASCRKHLLESMFWQGSEAMLINTHSVAEIRKMLMGIESLKQFQEKHNMPILTREIFHKYFEDFDTECSKHEWRGESMDGFLNGYIIQHATSEKEYLEQKEVYLAFTELPSKCAIS